MFVQNHFEVERFDSTQSTDNDLTKRQPNDAKVELKH